MRYCNNYLLVLCALSWFALVPLAATAQPSCNLLTSADPVPPVFGAAYNVLTLERELLLSVQCGPAADAMLVAGNGQDTLYIYKTAYEWTGSQWRKVTLSGHNRAGDWYIGSATANLMRSETHLLEDTCSPT
jgi:hypothetical protein